MDLNVCMSPLSGYDSSQSGLLKVSMRSCCIPIQNPQYFPTFMIKSQLLNRTYQALHDLALSCLPLFTRHQPQRQAPGLSHRAKFIFVFKAFELALPLPRTLFPQILLFLSAIQFSPPMQLLLTSAVPHCVIQFLQMLSMYHTCNDLLAYLFQFIYLLSPSVFRVQAAWEQRYLAYFVHH